MNWHTWLAAGLIVAVGALHYGLMIQSLRDLRRRPRVRGENKVLWGLVVLCIPFAGALAYAVYGPTSFRDRPPPSPGDPNRQRGLPTHLPGLPDDMRDHSAGGPAAARQVAARRRTPDKGDS